MSCCASSFKRFMDREGVRYNDENDNIFITYDVENAGSVTVMVSFDDSGHVNFLSLPVMELTQSKFAAALVACNALNNQYRWVRFYLKDNDICADADAVVDEDTCGRECMEYVLRMVDIIDKAYPQLMKVKWA